MTTFNDYIVADMGLAAWAVKNSTSLNTKCRV